MDIIAATSVFLVLFLAPLIPAYATYKLLPASPVQITGAFAGLKINAGGAFATFFILFVGLFIVTDVARTLILQPIERTLLWQIEGQYRVTDENGNPVHLNGHDNPVKVSLDPGGSAVDDNGSFSVRAFKIDGELPTVWVQIPGMWSERVLLNSGKDDLDIDEKQRLVIIKSPVLLRVPSNASSYSPAAGNLQPAATNNSGGRP